MESVWSFFPHILLVRIRCRNPNVHTSVLIQIYSNLLEFCITYVENATDSVLGSPSSWSRRVVIF